jgi:hypothetical protein
MGLHGGGDGTDYDNRSFNSSFENKFFGPFTVFWRIFEAIFPGFHFFSLIFGQKRTWSAKQFEKNKKIDKSRKKHHHNPW